MYVESYPTKVASVVAIQAVRPDDNPAYPAPFATYAKDCGHWLGYEQIYDNRDMLTIANTMNAAVASSATYFQTNVGGGGHCCWNTWYDPTHTDSYALNGTSGNWSVYQYMVTWSGCTTGAPMPPSVSAGSNQTVNLGTSAPSAPASGANFNFSNAPAAVSGWTNMSGAPGTLAVTAKDPSGIQLSSVSTANWSAYLGGTSYNGNGENTPGYFGNASVTINNWYQYGETQAVYDSTRPQLLATGLAVGTAYTVKLSGSIAFPFDASPTSYRIKGQNSYGPANVDLDSTGNNGASFSSVYPDASGSIRIFVNTVSGQSQLAPLNGLQIIPSGSTAQAQTAQSTTTASVILDGTASGKNGATISKTAWTETSGAAATIVSPSSLTTSVTGLVAGTYNFLLTATDNHGLTASSTVSVTVDASIPSGSPGVIQVDLYGGTNPYGNAAWNDWNAAGATASPVTSSPFTYSNGSPSPVTATLNFEQGIADNGANYGGTIAPPAVLRYCSYSSQRRSLVISNIPSSSVSLSLYGSRASEGNETIYTIGSTSETLVTDNNLINASVFSNVPVSNGQIIIQMDKIGSFNYLNGFTLTLGSTASTASASALQEATSVENADSAIKQLLIFPNPATDRVFIRWTSPFQGTFTIRIIDLAGRVLYAETAYKSSELYSATLPVATLSKGIYLVQVTLPGAAPITTKIIKQGL
jgi:hypothetical protein